MDDSKKKILEATLSQIRRQFGQASIMRLGDGSVDSSVEVIPTGSLGLDLVLGVGGLPRGRIVEIYGPEATGKTSLSLSVIAQVQKMGGTAAFIDAEHALNTPHATALGVNLDDLLISQPSSGGEEALEIVDHLVRSAAVDVVVVDSVAALTPRAELDGEMGDSFMGLHARLMSQALRKLTGSINKSKTLVIFINQIRLKIGQIYGSPEVTTGGNALKFYSSVRLDIRKIGWIKKGDEIVGIQSRVKVVKNKVAPPFKTCEFDMIFEQGISKEGELIDLGVENGIVERAGAWYSFGDTRIGQGRDNARLFLKDNPDIANKIESMTRQKFNLDSSEGEKEKQPQKSTA